MSFTNVLFPPRRDTSRISSSGRNCSNKILSRWWRLGGLILVTLSLLGGALDSSAGVVVWTENFEGAALGATSGNNTPLPGTVIETANTGSSVVVDASTDPIAAAAFTFASGKFIRLSTGANNFTAVRPTLNPISFAQMAATNPYTLSFDLYIPANLSVAVGDIQPRFTLNGVGGAGATISTQTKSAAGQYHVVYSGLVSDFIGTDVNEARPFIGIDQAGAALADYLYLDNIHFVVGTDPGVTLPNAAYFAALRSTPLASTPLVRWQQFGPSMSGYIDMFWINNGDPKAMYTQLDMGNNHLTLNGGEYWTSYRDIDGNGNQYDGTTYVEFSHQNPDFGLMTAKDGFYQSNDRGRTWQFLVDEDLGSSEKHNVLAVDPSNDNNWYAGAGQGWQIKFTHYNKNGIAITSDRNHSSGFIMYSKNRGTNWTRVYSPFPADSSFSRIIVDPRNSNHVYASCQNGVYKSTNGGVSWTKVTGNGLPYNQPRDMGYYFDGTNEFLLYIVEITHYTPNGNTIDTTGGVYRSADGGANWENLTGNLGINLNQMNTTYQQFNGDTIRSKYYDAIAFWLGITDVNAQALYPVLPTNTFSQFHQIAVDPTDKNRVYLVHNFKHDYSFPPGNIWMTSNSGTNWVAAAREGTYWIDGIDAAYWSARPGQSSGMNVTFAHVDREHREHNDYQTGPRFVRCNQLGEVYSAFSQQVMRSTDHGATWVQVDDDETSPGSGHWVGRGNCNLPGETFCLDTRTPGTYLWGSGEHGLWRNTQDGDLVYPGAIAVEQLTGQSYEDYDSLSISDIAIHPNDSNKIYTLQFRQGHRGELRYSPNNGATWQTLSTPIVFPAQNDVIDQRSLLIDPQNPNNIYFCVPRSEWERWSGPFVANGPAGWNGHGIYKSLNGGVSWTMATNGIPVGGSVYRMAMNPTNAQIIYAALNESHDAIPGGLYKTINGGTNWSAVTLPAGIVSVNDVEIQKATGDLFIACGTRQNAGETGGGFVSRDGGATWQLLFDMPYLRGFGPSQTDTNVIVANVDKAATIGQINPGAYVSVDAGTNWFKINNVHGQPDGVRKIEPDPHDKNVLWMSLHGTGFFRADISPLFTGQTNAPLFWDWMEANGQMSMFVDADMDGHDSRQEYVAGTNPGHAASVFRATVVPGTGGGVKIQFNTISNRLYAVEYKNNLAASWTTLTSGIVGTGETIEVPDNAGLPNRVYRVRVNIQ